MFVAFHLQHCYLSRENAFYLQYSLRSKRKKEREKERVGKEQKRVTGQEGRETKSVIYLSRVNEVRSQQTFMAILPNYVGVEEKPIHSICRAVRNKPIVVAIK